MKSLIIAIVLVLSAIVSAQPGEWSGFLGFGGTIPTGDSQLSGSVTINSLEYSATCDIEVNANLATRIGARYSLLEWLSFGGSFDYSGIRLDRVSYADYTLLNRLGMAHTFSLLVFVELRVETGAGIEPYCQLGGGMNFNYFDAKPDIAKNLFDEKHTPAFHVALGCKFFTDAAMGLFVEVRYLHNESTWDVSHSTASFEAELQNVAVLAGLTLHGRE